MSLTPTFETSAGGLVVRIVGNEAQAALIGRSGRSQKLRWSLPKGHVEPGESLEQTAIREVHEETGIVGSIVARLGSFRYTFTANGQRVTKRVHHFLMRAESGELSDADVEVTAVEWVALARLPQVLAFPAERRIARRAATLLAGEG